MAKLKRLTGQAAQDQMQKIVDVCCQNLRPALETEVKAMSELFYEGDPHARWKALQLLLEALLIHASASYSALLGGEEQIPLAWLAHSQAGMREELKKFVVSKMKEEPEPENSNE